jgi:hypothetical protein
MKPKRLTDRNSRMFARRERDAQWAFMERIAKEGVVWMCPWDKYHRHGKRCENKGCESRTFEQHQEGWQCARCKNVTAKIPDDGVYVFGLLGSAELFYWINSHKDWWKKGRWSDKRCARSIRLTEAGKKALANQHLYDTELIYGGMVEPGYVVKPWPRKKAE